MILLTLLGIERRVPEALSQYAIVGNYGIYGDSVRLIIFYSRALRTCSESLQSK